MNTDKICFIACVNDEEMYGKSLHYIKKLKIPPNINIETLALKGQKSMTEGYNNAMRQSNAKYKVYMHQDTIIINENFISDVLKIFKSNNKIGMLGVVGCKDIPPKGMWWQAAQLYGKVYDRSGKASTYRLLSFNDVKNEYISVKGIDGLIMITQHDVPWREDIFKGWHFYDMSQCLEFVRNGYQVVIPSQETAWVIHACGIPSNACYDYYRKIFLREYEYDIFKKGKNILQRTFFKTHYKLQRAWGNLIQRDKYPNPAVLAYNKTHYETTLAAPLTSAETIVPTLIKLFNPTSVVDIGCGTGAWLSIFQNQGVTITGIDGDYVPREMLLINDTFFIKGDLSAKIPVNNKYDMAVSLEVAGSLPEERAQSFVKELTDLSPVVIFSSPIPSAEEPQYMNAQWPDYWVKLFSGCGYYAFDIIRPQIWEDDTLDARYKTNMIVYCDKTIVEKYPELLQWENNLEKDVSFNLIYPTNYIEQIRELRYYRDKLRNYRKKIYTLALTSAVLMIVVIIVLIK